MAGELDYKTLSIEYKRWLSMLVEYLTELQALKESIREIHYIDNTLASKIVPFEDAVNQRIGKTKDLQAKVRIQEDEINYVLENNSRKQEYHICAHDRLKEEMKKLHKEHLQILDSFFNEVIL